MAKKTMKKKALKKKTQSKSAVDKFAGPVVDSAREIWLAGLGAFHFAQSESGKVIEQGNKLFERLVAEGKKLDKKTRGVAESTVGGLRDDVESKVSKVRRQAVDNWDKLEGIFEDRVARVMGQLGVPTSDEITALTEQVEALSSQVAKLTATKSPVKKTAAKKAAAKKPVAKKATKKVAAKKVASKKATARKTGSKKAVAKKAATKTASSTAASSEETVAGKADDKK